MDALRKLLEKAKYKEEPNMSVGTPAELTEQEASAVVNANQDLEVTPAQEIATEVANKEAKSPYMKTEEELVSDQVGRGLAAPEAPQEVDPYRQKLVDSIKQYEGIVNNKPEKKDWKQNLPDILAAAHNIMNYGQGSLQPNLKTDYVANQQKAEDASRKEKLSGIQKLQDMYRKTSNTDGMTPLEKAKLDLEKKKLKLKEDELKNKPKEMSYKEKEEAKAQAKEDIEVKKENRKEKKVAQDSVKSIDEQIDNVKKARKLLSDSTKNKIADTGPIDQFVAKTTDQGQQLEQAMNAVSLDKMVKMFAGMSKAIDSDAERAFFQSAQPSMGKYPTVNKKVLDDMLLNLESLKNKNKMLIQNIDETGNRTEGPMMEEKAPSIDPKIKGYADEHGLEYENAERILRSRGYNG